MDSQDKAQTGSEELAAKLIVSSAGRQTPAVRGYLHINRKTMSERLPTPEDCRKISALLFWERKKKKTEKMKQASPKCGINGVRMKNKTPKFSLKRVLKEYLSLQPTEIMLANP